MSVEHKPSPLLEIMLKLGYVLAVFVWKKRPFVVVSVGMNSNSQYAKLRQVFVYTLLDFILTKSVPILKVIEHIQFMTVLL